MFGLTQKPSKGKPILYVITWLIDFAVMLVVFYVSRGLAESQASLLKMGVIGAVFSFFHAGSSIFFGRLSDRIGRSGIIIGGAVLLTLFAGGCFILDPDRIVYIVIYCSTGLAMGMMYPAMVAWISSSRVGPRKISGGIIRFCIAWNLGMISGQLTGGFLFPVRRTLPLLIAVCLGTAAVVLVFAASRKTSAGAVPAQAPAAVSASEPGVMEAAAPSGTLQSGTLQSGELPCRREEI